MAASTSLGNEKILQADFQAGSDGAPTGWRFAAQRGRCTGKWDMLDGGRCIRLHIADDPAARATWMYGPRIPVKGSTAYRLSVRKLVAETTERSKVYVIAYENGYEGPSHWHHTPHIHGTQDWRTYTITFRTRPDATWLKLQCKLWYGTGYAWFDDLVIEELPPDAEIAAPDVSQRPPPPGDGSPLQLMWYPAQRRPDRTLRLLDRSFNPVACFPWGDKAAVRAPHLVIETPRAMAVAGPVVAGRRPMPPDVSVEPTPVEREGRQRLRWRLPIPAESLRRNLKPDDPFWTGYHFVYAEPQPGCPKSFEWRWQLECDGKLGPEHYIAAAIEEKVGGELPAVEHFPLYAQHTGALRYPTAAGRRRVLDYLCYAAIHGGLSLTHYQPEYSHIDAELAAAGFRTWAWKFDAYGRGGIEDYSCVYSSERHKRGERLCPSVQVERLKPWWDGLLAYYRSRLASGLKMLIIDYEPPTYRVCFCERCRANFALVSGLNAAKAATMTPDEILALPDHAWGRFRSQQNGQIVKNHIAAIHEIDPEVEVGLCCSPYTPWTAQHGMDIRLFEPEVAFHAPMIYSVGTTYEGLVRSTCENTKRPVLPFLLASDMAVKGPFPLPEDVRLNMLATALSGGRGAILWVGIESLDGEYLNALRRSLEEIRVLQEYSVGGTRAADLEVTSYSAQSRTITVDGRDIVVPQSDSRFAVRSWAWRSRKGTLVAVINYDKANAHCVRVPGAAKAKALMGPPPRARQDDAVLTVPPYGFVALRW